MPMLWIEYTDDDGDTGSARWGSVSVAQIDAVLAKAVAIAGEPDTLT